MRNAPILLSRQILDLSDVCALACLADFGLSLQAARSPAPVRCTNTAGCCPLIVWRAQAISDCGVVRTYFSKLHLMMTED